MRGRHKTSWDSQWVVAARSGDRSALGKLAETFCRPMHHVALGIVRSMSAAQDVAQDAWMIALHRLRQIREPRAFPGWIRQITRRAAFNFLRHTPRTTPLHAQDGLPLVSPVSTPVETAVQRDQAAWLRDGLRRLDEGDRLVLETHYFEGLSVQEISEREHVPVGTIKRRLFDARRRLKAILQKDDKPACSRTWSVLAASVMA
jgi:RNA polymerase sigma-70 factor (ECF subfamily)